MPRLSEFYGIVIYMYWKDHAPPHFHAIYAGHEALISVEDGTSFVATFPAQLGIWCSSGGRCT